jgi:hypothetical protein
MNLHALVLYCIPFGALALAAGSRRTAELGMRRPMPGCVLMHGLLPSAHR